MSPRREAHLRRPLRGLARLRRLQRQRRHHRPPARRSAPRSSRRRPRSRGRRRRSGSSPRRSAKAYRFATAAELYQLVSTGTTFTSPDPNLKPDNVLATEFKLERASSTAARGLAVPGRRARRDHLAVPPARPRLDASCSRFLSNVDHVRARGAELVLRERDVFVRGLELSGSVTYLDARTLAPLRARQRAAPAGQRDRKRLPEHPQLARALRCHVPARLSAGRFTFAGRYSGMLYTTLDNADVHPNTYQGFGAWFVADAHGQLPDRSPLVRVSRRGQSLQSKVFPFSPVPAADGGREREIRVLRLSDTCSEESRRPPFSGGLLKPRSPVGGSRETRVEDGVRATSPRCTRSANSSRDADSMPERA